MLNGVAIVLFSAFKTRKQEHNNILSKVQSASITPHFAMGHQRSLEEIKFMRRKSSHGTTPGMVVEGGPRVLLGSCLTNVDGTISDDQYY